MSSLDIALLLPFGKMSSCKRVVVPDSFTLYKFKGEKPPLLVFVGSFVTMKPIPLVAVETSSADTEIVVKSNDDANKDVKSFLERFLIC